MPRENYECIECGRPTKETWHKYCWEHYKEHNPFGAPQQTTNHTAQLEARLHEAAKQIKELKKLAVTEEQVKLLLQLCHPDKHDNSELSNAVTKWLLSAREHHRGTNTRRSGQG